MDSFKLLVIFIISAAAVTGLPLDSSPDGNKFDDLLNTKSRNLLSRHKRDTYEELARTAETCCNAPKSALNDDPKKIQCMQEISSKFSVTVTEAYLFSQKESNETACFTECVLRKNNAIDNGGQIIVKAAVDHLAQCPGFKDQKVLDKVTVACATLSAANGGANGQAYVCNTAPLLFLRCAYDIKMVYCPVEHHIQSERCTKFWEELNSRKQ